MAEIDNKKRKQLLKEKTKERQRKQILRDKEKNRKQILKDREKKKEIKKEQIVRAAIELYKKRGFEKTTVEDIALNANVATGTFYTYFKEKDDVFLFFWNKASRKSTEWVQKKMETKNDFFDQLELLVNRYLKNVFQDKEFAKHIFIHKRLPKWGTQDENELRLLNSISRIIEHAKQMNLINKQVATEQIAEILFAIHTIYLMYWLNGTIKTRKECISRINLATKITLSGFSFDPNV